jgi:tetratricopeptide (TPR) repeat protein
MYVHAHAKLWSREARIRNHQVGRNFNELQSGAIRSPKQFANAFCGSKGRTAFCWITEVMEDEFAQHPDGETGLVPSALLLESPRTEKMHDEAARSEARRQQAEDHYYAALDHVAEGHDEQAVEEYRQSLAADPTFTDALHGLSRALQNLNRLDEAIEVSQQISEIDPDDILAHTSLSILYQKKGMVPEAEAEGNKARILGWKQQLKKGGG